MGSLICQMFLPELNMFLAIPYGNTPMCDFIQQPISLHLSGYFLSLRPSSALTCLEKEEFRISRQPFDVSSSLFAGFMYGHELPFRLRHAVNRRVRQLVQSNCFLTVVS
jgi:hypothetical protein